MPWKSPFLENGETGESRGIPGDLLGSVHAREVVDGRVASWEVTAR